MIRHICMFTLKEENKAANVAEFLERAEVLRDIDVIKRFEVVKNAENAPASNYDVSLIIDVENILVLDEYQTSPIHVEFAKFVATVKEGRACIDFEC